MDKIAMVKKKIQLMWEQIPVPVTENAQREIVNPEDERYVAFDPLFFANGTRTNIPLYLSKFSLCYDIAIRKNCQKKHNE